MKVQEGSRRFKQVSETTKKVLEGSRRIYKALKGARRFGYIRFKKVP